MKHFFDKLLIYYNQIFKTFTYKPITSLTNLT